MENLIFCAALEKENQKQTQLQVTRFITILYVLKDVFKYFKVVWFSDVQWYIKWLF